MLCAVSALAEAPREAGKGGPSSFPAGRQELSVADSSDEAEEFPSGRISLPGSDLELVYDEAREGDGNQTVGIRFVGAKIPRGATIRTAFIQFTGMEATAEACHLAIRGQAVDSAPAFTEEPKNTTARPRTKAEVRWDPLPWKANSAGAAERTSDLSPIVQEIVSRPGWAPGNSLVFIITGQGKGMRRAYCYDGDPGHGPRLRVEWQPAGSVREEAKVPAPVPPVGGVASSAPAAPAAAPEPVQPSSTPLAETVNLVIDYLVSTGSRLLELPLFMLLGAIGFVAVALALLGRLLFGKGGRGRLYHALLAVLAVAVLLTGACVVDQKIGLLQVEVRQLHSKMSSDAAALLEVAHKQTVAAAAAAAIAHRAFLFDTAAAEEALRSQFHGVRMQTQIYDEATDLVQLRLTEAVAQAWVVVVNLQHPGLAIRLDTVIKTKRLTSEFARENNCGVAINGEAGRSSERDSGLGEWTGHMVTRGQVILAEGHGNPRPFLSFDKRNHATYVPAAAPDRKLPPDTVNAIWGRFDTLLAGAVVKQEGGNQPRTAMAIDEKGTRLYLIVVDGRQPGYSQGMEGRDVARVLKALGAHNAMLCDQGGSSCIYLKGLGGIANIPSNGGGQERPTYTHFGLALAAGE